MAIRMSKAIAAVMAILTLAIMVPLSAEAEATSHEAVPTALPAGARNDPSYRLAVEKRVETYVTNKHGIVQFDLRLAQQNGENPDVVEVGKYVNAFAASNTPSQTKSWDECTSAGSDMSSGYRYCGYGRLGGQPTNTLDRGCQLRDRCYDRRGMGKALLRI
ncbi:hypothetical protein SAMN05660282_01714 [Corynebacterium spheniscorum]|uniref:Phospholipase A2 n=1 Tax=Corynebacterium spheniscorum TaxID=185761 RepID=A0A1I2U2L9_9CORY|nr:hypothetical protein SAMN05660282_01714 [Corynebacterium spheniscorum]